MTPPGQVNRCGLGGIQIISRIFAGMLIREEFWQASEYCVDKNSGQYKAPFNMIYNFARVFTYKDT